MVQSVEEKSLLLQSSGDNDVGTDVAAFIAIDEAGDNKKTLRTTKCKSYDDLASTVYTDMNLCRKTFSKSTNFILSSVKSSAHISLENSQDDVFRPQTEHNTAGKHIVINEDSDPASASGTVVVKFQHARGYVFPEHHECQHYFQTCEESMVNLIDAEYYDSTWNNEIGNLIQNHIGPCRVIYPQRSYETSQSSESVICRICHSYGDDRLIAPCKCDGSTRYVHATCLVTWFKKSVKNQCELCKSDVKIRKINHNIAVWRKPEDRPIPLIWFSVFFIGLFLNVLSIYVNASESCKSTACLIFYVVNGFGIILDAAFLWFWFHKCRYYWQKWCALNQDWYIDDLDDTNDVHVEYVKNQRGQIV